MISANIIHSINILCFFYLRIQGDFGDRQQEIYRMERCRHSTGEWQECWEIGMDVTSRKEHHL